MKSGTLLGPYEIIERLGVGGMGEVWLAEDTTLKRGVAIKLLPGDLAADPERLARLEREAQLLASLNHPHISSIYSLEREGDTRFLVLELVEGKTLAERLQTGPLPVQEALEIAGQIAEALEAAHDNGIVHRDLKPANVMVTAEGNVKVLDFGLAKAYEAAGSSEMAPDLTHSPTLAAATQTGVILGTAAYMSPEQARGKPLDKRTDIWSFGCVVYEMLAGKAAFSGETVSDTMAAILTVEPDWETLPTETPAPIEVLVRRCLSKKARFRLRDIGDAWVELSEVTTNGDSLASARLDPSGTGATSEREVLSPKRAHSRSALVLLPVVIVLAILAGWQLAQVYRPGPSTSPLTPYLELMLPEAFPLYDEPHAIAVLAISPDGSTLVFTAQNGGDSLLAVRTLDSPEVSPILNTEGAKQPFFSPDGQWLGFFADGALYKIALGGGSPVRLADAPSPWGGAWVGDEIVFTPSNSTGLWRVSEGGGDSELLTELRRERGEFAHDFPFPLPGGRGVLFTTIMLDGRFETSRLDLNSGTTSKLFDGGSFAQYHRPGHVMYGDGQSILSRPFDLETGEILGPLSTVAADVLTDERGVMPRFALSESGVLVYALGGRERRRHRLTWVERDGSITPLPEEVLVLRENPRLSPDGEKIATIKTNRGVDSLVIHEIGRGVISERVLDGPVGWQQWSPDGEWVAFTTGEADPEGNLRLRIWRVRADGSGPVEEFVTFDSDGAESLALTSWSRDGRLLAFRVSHAGTGNDVGIVSTEAPHEVRMIARSPAQERAGALSADGRLIAYTSTETGNTRVYVREVDDEGVWTVSGDGGEVPIWGPAGDELFFRLGRGLMRVGITTEPEIRFGAPQQVLEWDFATGGGSYDVSPDGDRFLMIESDTSAPPSTRLVVRLNWPPPR